MRLIGPGLGGLGAEREDAARHVETARRGADPVPRRLHLQLVHQQRRARQLESFSSAISTGHDALNETRSRMRR